MWLRSILLVTVVVTSGDFRSHFAEGANPSTDRAGMSGGRMPTRWDKDVSPTHPLPEYPRPQMVRPVWQNLNGPWDLAVTDGTEPNRYDRKILVPYPFEAALSGVGEPSPATRRIWYRRQFTVPTGWTDNGRRVLLHLGAVNWEAVVSVNGTTVGEHRGGYDGFEFDITDALRAGENQITVAVRNPLISDTPGAQILGKQRVTPVSVLYTAASGIWQTVWMEPVPSSHVTGLKMTPDVDSKVLRVAVTAVGGPAPGVPPVRATIVVTDGDHVLATATGPVGEITIPIPDPHLWSPTDPHLYGLHVSLDGGDSVDSYAAMRKISLGKDDQGRTRILLNNQFVFQVGALDQGYWPDGVYTAPTDDALASDIRVAQKLGFNLLRKHAKVEPERWYYWTDKLGMLVWQDMPQAFGDDFTAATKEQWTTEMSRMIDGRFNHPSIIMWTLFNEGWGQHDTAAVTALARKLDPTRLLNAASGGYSQLVDGKMSRFRLPTPAGIGDVNDTHTYPDPTTEKQDPARALVCGEFGGISFRVPGHVWSAGNFGYGAVMHNGWQLTRRYQQVMKEGLALRDAGASGVVYTQIVDVENETNGMLTYDREVIKPIPDFVAAANHGQYLPLPAEPTRHDLVPTSEDVPRMWSYTTTKPATIWTAVDFDASAWKTGPAPFGQGYAVNTPWTDTPGDIWLRRTIELPATIPDNLTVRAKHDEDVEVYINGVLAASGVGYTGDYASLPVSAECRKTIKPGRNVIAVHCRQTVGGQVIDVGISAAD